MATKRLLILLCAVLLLSLLPTMVLAVDGINDANYFNNPAIKKVRNIYRQINAAESTGSLKEKSRSCEENGGSIELYARLFKDRAGLTRKYVFSGGSGDSALVEEYYYDTKGTLRFTLQTLNSANGTSIKELVYFDEHGRHLYTNRKEEGPGYPDDSFKPLLRDPDTHYAELCR